MGAAGASSSRPVKSLQKANTSGDTLKYLASLPMWLRFKQRLPLRTSEIVESASPGPPQWHAAHS